jgi:hypothetical protein
VGILVDPRIASYQSDGNYRLEQRRHTLLDNRKTPCCIFILAQRTEQQPDSDSLVGKVLGCLQRACGPKDCLCLAGKIVCLARVSCLDSYVHAVRWKGGSQRNYVVSGMGQYLALERVWALRPPMSFEWVKGQVRNVSLSADVVTSALGRILM